ncbi:MAG TPA: YwiC-like family protein [Anaeromyxobacter sp.]|nr:YwiC-like family protein [Anaeromyxobacter sp.]
MPPKESPSVRRALVPHEHGAWGQMVLSLSSGLALGRFTAAALLLALAVVLLFIAHEPLLVSLGHRGERLRQSEGARALGWAAALGALAGVAGAAGIYLAQPGARLWALPPVVLAGSVAWLSYRRSEKTVAGEIAVASAFASAAGVVARAGLAEGRVALAVVVCWILSFAAATLAVQAVLLRARTRGERDPRATHGTGVALLWALAVALAGAGLPATVPVAVSPTLLLSLCVCLVPVSARRLRLLGWALVGSSLLTLVVLVGGLR